MNMRDDDPVRHLLVVDTHDTLLFFTSRGRVLPLKAYELRPDISRNTRGIPVVNVIPLSDDETVQAIVAVKSLQESGLFLIMATQEGGIKRVALNAIANIRRAGLIIFNLRSSDRLITARLATEDNDVMMVTREGMSIRFPVADVKSRLRAAGGVRGMSLKGKDRIVSMDVVIPESKLLVISKNGFGKLTYLKNYRTQGRGGLGIKTMAVTKRTGPVAAAEVIADSDEVYVVSVNAQVIRTSLSEIRSTGRATQGVRIFKPREGDSVASISCVGEFEVPEEKIAPTTPATPVAEPETNGTQNGTPPETGRLFE
jgi:DNA gyrase subunit A